MEEKIGRGWFSDRSDHPRAFPLHITPGGMIEKKEQKKQRLINNAITPRADSKHDMVTLDDGSKVLVSANFSTNLLEYMHFEWAAIESVGESIEIISQTACSANIPKLVTTWLPGSETLQTSLRNAGIAKYSTKAIS